MATAFFIMIWVLVEVYVSMFDGVCICACVFHNGCISVFAHFCACVSANFGMCMCVRVCMWACARVGCSDVP